MSAAAASRNDVISLSKTTAILAVLGALASPLAAGAVLKYQSDDNQRRIEILERKVETLADVLTRVDENVKFLVRERNRNE